MQTWTIFQVILRWLGAGFHTWAEGLGANWCGNMLWFGGSLTLVLISWKLRIMQTWVLKLEPQNLSPIEMCQILVSNLACVSMPRWLELSKHIPIKICNVSGAMFWSHVPIFHVSPCDLHPCPMTHPWCFRLFSILHCHRVFLHWILTFSSPLPRQRYI